MFGTTLTSLIAWKVIYFFVYRELHNLNATQKVSPSSFAIRLWQQWLVQYMINLSGIRRWERFLSRNETYSTLSPLFYQFYAYLELSECIKSLSKFESRSCLFAFFFTISITLLYYYFLNSVYLFSNEKLKGKASTKVSFRIVSTAFLTQVSL